MGEEQLLLILVGISIALGIAYTILIASYCYGWIKTRSTLTIHALIDTKVTIVIAARNEEDTITHCLTSILNQSYSSNYFEIIVIDDASVDATNEKIQPFCDKNNNIKLITLEKDSIHSGKKRAIHSAIKEAKGELIVTTDADCIMGIHWLSTIVSFYKQSNAKMIVAPVSFYNEKTIFEKMQSLEFMALMASTGASLYFNKAIMCNGANLAYPKDVFHEVNGFEGIDDIISGDDVLLMYKIKRKYPKGIQFLKHTDAMVNTKPKSTVKEFINQRKRWASKGFKVLNTETKWVSLIVFLFNLVLLAMIAMSFIYYRNAVLGFALYKICFILIGIKSFIDFLLLFLAASFFNRKHFLIYFLPEQIIYIVYIAMVGLLGLTGKYEWKGRKTN